RQAEACLGGKKINQNEEPSTTGRQKWPPAAQLGSGLKVLTTGSPHGYLFRHKRDKNPSFLPNPNEGAQPKGFANDLGGKALPKRPSPKGLRAS
ncbi:MAG TPA: hypothetical protein VF630_06005, partial [Hymenobacter sp.]